MLSVSESHVPSGTSRAFQRKTGRVVVKAAPTQGHLGVTDIHTRWCGTGLALALNDFILCCDKKHGSCNLSGERLIWGSQFYRLGSIMDGRRGG